MGRARGYGLGLGLVFGITLGAPVVLSGVDAPVAAAALTLLVENAAAQPTIDAEECGVAILCTTSEAEGGDGVTLLPSCLSLMQCLLAQHGKISLAGVRHLPVLVFGTSTPPCCI
jgi:hypothetical protein